MVSFPDALLRSIDMEAARRGTTRSGFLRDLAKETLTTRSARRAALMAELDAEGEPPGHGGQVAELLKSTRPDR
jgi:hypothetical protein